MTIQKEIREGVKPYLRSMITASHYNALDDKAFDSRILEILKFLDSKNVVVQTNQRFIQFRTERLIEDA